MGKSSNPLFDWWMNPSDNDPQYIALNVIAACIAGGGVYGFVKGIHKLCSGNENPPENASELKKIWLDFVTRFGGFLQAKIGFGLAVGGILSIVFSKEIIQEWRKQNFKHKYL